MTLFTHSNLKAYLLSLTAILISFQLAVGGDVPFLVAQYTDEHGLPQNSIKGIGQDNLGFVWLISEKGPVRYDGQGQFKTFDDLSGVLKTIRMSALYSGGQLDELLAKSEYGELILLKNGKAAVPQKTPYGIASNFALYYPENLHYNLSLPSPYQTDIPSHVFVPDGLEGGFIVSRDSISRIGEDGKPSNAVYFPNASPWKFAGYQGKLIYFGKTLDYVEIGADLQLKKKKISGDILHLPPDTHFDIYWNTASHQLFMYAEDNLYRLAKDNDGNLHSTLLLTGFDFVKNDIITACYLASQEQLLLGSMTKGLFVIKRKHFRSLGVGDQYSSSVYYNQTHLPNGLLATDHGVTFDQSGYPNFSSISQLDNPKYGQILGPDGNLWILQSKRLLIMTPDLKRVIGTKLFPALPRVAFKDDSSNYWFGGEQGALLRYDADADTFRTEASFPGMVTYLERKSDSALLVGTKEGLFVFNTINGSQQEILLFKGKQIRSIRNESDRRYWITTYQYGFFLYENGELTDFPLDQNNYLEASHCTLEDQNGFLWISTNKGLFKVSKQQLLDYRSDHSQKPFYFYYDKRWGFDTNEFNGGCQPCAIQLPDGHFSFPSLNGLVQFNPLAIKDEFPADAIILDQVMLNGKSIPIRDTLQIPRHFSRLDLKIAIPFYGNPYNIQIEYRLDNGVGIPNEWLPISNSENTLSFNELAAGNHEIGIRIRKGIGPEAFHHTTFHLYKTPFFYETGWFTLIFCLLIGALIWLIIYVRTRFILNQNRRLTQKVHERTADLKRQYDWQQRLSASITHDIRTPLNYVLKSLQRMQQTAKAQDFLPDEMEQVYRSTEHIYHYSNNLTRLAKVSLTKEWLTFTAVCLHSITQRQISAFTSLATSRGNVVYNRIPLGIMVHSHADVLSIILHNVLDNAIKFTEHGEITLAIENQTSSLVMLRIADTGVGLHPEQIESYNDRTASAPIAASNGKQTGLGLLLVKDMAHLIQADSTMESALGRGTVITFVLHRYRH